MSTVAIAAVGSRGDVAPLAGLGAALQQAGHRVTIAAYTPFADLIIGAGCEFRELPADFTPGTDHAEASSKELFAAMFAPSGQRDTGQMIIDALGEVPADILLLPPLAELAGHPLAEAQGIPSVGVRMQPISPTADYPPSLLGAWSLGGFGNRMAAGATAWAIDRLYGGVVAHCRRELGLPRASARALRRRRTAADWPILHAYSPNVVSRPVDWRTGLQVTGYWWPPTPVQWQPPQVLGEFLAAGPAPVFIGLGSTVVTAARAEQLAEIIAAGLRQAGVRGIVQSGWAGIDVTGENILTIRDTPHEWLFPQMAAIAHHCGAGTTAAALRAGIPSIPLPGPAGDQPFWAQRLHSLGVAITPLPQRRLTAHRLAAAIRTTLDDADLRETTQRLASRVAGEDGTAAAVTAIEQLLYSSHR
ncbi:glycosyltransferase [Mycobacterium sp. ITM-2016-00316]|uniref:glycosyltransferase n=1 Tax=Mycobacterium sp. ITM-2016-00316 TaxID=2099695 RepID=UPI000CFA4E37|nr:glycosyltransferase [Mycobacterium sp. ITM-2016-00316]WNG82096.1 glycosyltransferase [Mycobacterium sp. ITM-2016-00316]